MSFQRVNSGDRVLERIQDNIEQALPSGAILNGVRIVGIAIVSGTAKTVNHGLGRKPLGYLEAGKSANANVWETTTQRTDRVLVLNASANVTLDLWVF